MQMEKQAMASHVEHVYVNNLCKQLASQMSSDQSCLWTKRKLNCGTCGVCSVVITVILSKKNYRQ